MRLSSAAALGALAASAAAPLAQVPPPSVEIVVGDSVSVCGRLATCPIAAHACDDAKVVGYDVGKAGPELKGLAPGTTLCALLGSSAVRTVVRVTVVPPPPAAAPPPAKGAAPERGK
jgi:hypothetical protein